jgi:hypothetical protein
VGNDTRSKRKGPMALSVAAMLAFDLALALLVRPWPLAAGFILLSLVWAYWSLRRK